MKHSPPSEANSNLAGQEIPRLLWNKKFYYLVNRSKPLLPILNQINPFHTFSTYLP